MIHAREWSPGERNSIYFVRATLTLGCLCATQIVMETSPRWRVEMYFRATILEERVGQYINVHEFTKNNGDKNEGLRDADKDWKNS